MKKSILFLALTMLIFLAFKLIEREDSYETLLPAEYKVDYVRSVDNLDLTNHIEAKMEKFFDNVERVDLHKHITGFHYYTIYGLKDGNPEFVMVKVSMDDIINEVVSFNDCGPFDICVWTNQGPEDCIPPNPIGIICGCQIPSLPEVCTWF